MTLPELVESVPDGYPKNDRTVRRDLEALEAVGFPLLTERHNGQTRWRLIECFRDIPALGFSATELMALTFSWGGRNGDRLVFPALPKIQRYKGGATES